jgi:carboxymethylenebutenolidase
MCEQESFDKDRRVYEARGLVTRQQFGVLLGAGVAMLLPGTANAMAVVENEVQVPTPYGVADAYFVHPAGGQWPAVLIWPDIFGLRPAFRQMGRRLAEAGYTVLVVNPFYRARRAPTADQGAATPIQDVMPLARTLSEATVRTDARAFLAWLDRQPAVDTKRPAGTQGYCMGGPMAFRTAVTLPERIGAVASFHGAGLVTDAPNSPHREVATTHAQFLVAIAESDHQRSPHEEAILRKAFAAAGLSAEVEVYEGTAHGWCPPDTHVYNEPRAERAWSRLLALYARALV